MMKITIYGWRISSRFSAARPAGSAPTSTV
jgi:hypothetical protein